MRLNLGCGYLNRGANEVGYDVDLACRPDVCGTAENLPFRDESFDEIGSVHCLDHVHGIVKAMNEAWRILKPDGRFYIRVPLFPSVGAVADPTHVRYFIPDTFRYFTHPGALTGLKHVFEMGAMKTTGDEIYVTLRKKTP